MRTYQSTGDELKKEASGGGAEKLSNPVEKSGDECDLTTESKSKSDGLGFTWPPEMLAPIATATKRAKPWHTAMATSPEVSRAASDVSFPIYINMTHSLSIMDPLLQIMKDYLDMFISYEP